MLEFTAISTFTSSSLRERKTHLFRGVELFGMFAARTPIPWWAAFGWTSVGWVAIRRLAIEAAVGLVAIGWAVVWVAVEAAVGLVAIGRQVVWVAVGWMKVGWAGWASVG